jgi:hypothetical protein
MKQLFLLLTIVVFLFAGCEKDSSSGNVTLKYEIVSTSAFSPVFSSGVQVAPPLTVNYINETGQQQNEQINTNSSTWSKTIQLTATQRPIIIMFNTTAYTASEQGTGVVKLYVNGVLKASQNVTIRASGFQAGKGAFTGYYNYPLY